MISSRGSNRLIAATLGLLSVGYLVVAFQIPDFAVGVTVQPGSFPKVLGVLMLILSVLLYRQRPAAAGPGGGAPAQQDGPPPAHPGPADETRADAAAPSARRVEPTAESVASAASAPRSATQAPTRAPTPEQPPSRPDTIRRDILVAFGSMVAYVALLRPLGFLLVTAIYLAGMTYYLGYRRHLINAATAIVVATGLFLLVDRAFGINMPAGPLPL